MDEIEIIHQLSRILYLYKKEIMMETRKRSDISGRDLMLLEIILRMNDAHPVKMNEISHYLNITPAAVSQSIRSFEKKGWVVRVQQENDRRSVYISITEEAIQMVKSHEVRMKENLKAFITSLGPDDAQAFVRIVEKGLQFVKDQRHARMEETKGDSND